MANRKGLFSIKIKYDDERIIDQKCNTIKEADSLFKDIKRKFR